jgi:VWFA-related protein
MGLALLAAPSLRAQESPVFPTGVEVVTVDAVVHDKKGRPVGGLVADDFVVTEDGVPQKITSFEALAQAEGAPTLPPPRTRASTNAPVRPARSFLIVFDDAHLTVPQAESAKQQLSTYLRTGFLPGDQVTLIPTSGGAWWTSEMPEGHDDLVAFLAHLKGQRMPDASAGHMTDYEAMRLVVYRDAQVGAEVLRRFVDAGVVPEPPSTQQVKEPTADMGHPLIRSMAEQIYRDATVRNNAALKALDRAAAAVSSAKGRKSVILVSPGFPYDNTLEGFRDVVQACRRANAVIYFLDARGLTGLPPGADAERGAEVEEQDIGTSLDLVKRESDGAESLAVDSGGLVFGANDLTAGLNRVVEDSKIYYLLGYRSTNARRDGKFRKIKVTVQKPGLEVAARKGYYAPSDVSKARQTPAGAEALDPDVRAALDSPFETNGIPLRLTSYVLGPSGSTRTTVLLVADADPRALAFRQEGGRLAAELDSYVLVTSRDTGASEPQEKRIDLRLPPALEQRLERSWLPILRTFELEAGTYEASLLLRDSAKSRIGTVRHEFAVPPPGSFHATTPILTDQLEADPGGGGGRRPVPLAHLEFATGAHLVHYFDVLGAAVDPQTKKPRVSVTYTLRNAEGARVAAIGPTPIAPGPTNELSQQTVLPLERVPPGDYELVVAVKDDVANKALDLRDSFTVVPAP